MPSKHQPAAPGFPYHLALKVPSPAVREEHIEYGFIGTRQKLKYEYRPDNRDRATLYVDKAPVVIKKLEEAVPNLKGDEARAAFINHFKEVQRLKAQQKSGNAEPQLGTLSPIAQLDFEFVIFASAVIDYDYIMSLISRFTEQAPGKQKMSREQLIGLIQSDAKFLNEREDIADYIATLKAGEGLSEKAIRDGYTRFKAEKDAQELGAIAGKHSLATAALQGFVDTILDRMIFGGEHLGDLMAPLDLGWKARTHADLHPLLRKRAQGREISGLSAYER